MKRIGHFRPRPEEQIRSIRDKASQFIYSSPDHLTVTITHIYATIFISSPSGTIYRLPDDNLDESKPEDCSRGHINSAYAVYLNCPCPQRIHPHYNVTMSFLLLKRNGSFHVKSIKKSIDPF